MTPKLDFETFLAQSHISRETWDASKSDWGVMTTIAQDHDAQLDNLRDSAQHFAGAIQRFPAVHSVRWRVKDTAHLIAKIVRKRAANNAKYVAINDKNYFEIVHDLVGLRALHLFKEECFSIDERLRATWNTAEQPTAYVREGDPPELNTRFGECGLEVKKHDAGYRSVHYVFSSQPTNRKVYTEVQVRTIFEEGWSEIDHRVRYPNVSCSPHVAVFLAIFNRLAGSADEMGGFVQTLANTLETARRETEQALQGAEKALAELNAMKKQDAKTSQQISTLQEEVARLRRLSSPSLAEMYSTGSNRLLAELTQLRDPLASLDIGNTQRVSAAGLLARDIAAHTAIDRAHLERIGIGNAASDTGKLVAERLTRLAAQQAGSARAGQGGSKKEPDEKK